MDRSLTADGCDGSGSGRDARISDTEIERLVLDSLGAADPRAELERLAAGRPDLFAAAWQVLQQAERLERMPEGLRLAEASASDAAAGLVVPPPGREQRDPGRHPSHIGPYRIVALVGKGGMGEVYKAEQSAPIRRIVALKVVQRQLATEEVLARFELERRALAVMAHRSIAKVFDAGVTESGEPYFVMEFVEGLPLTTYCDRHKLSVVQRLRLFQQVCAGVQHAHQKGIVHRDLKPGNVLVAHEGDEPAAKILDFGLAKAISPEFLDAEVATAHDRVMGTLEYMAPEQMAGDGDLIDARADVYALGVMLYELLAGELPFSTEALRRAGHFGALQLIRDSEPPRPSTRLASLGGRAGAVADRRRTSVDSLSRVLRGDLDWVVMKAMAREPERRYDAASALAEDLDRYLRHEPVLAGPPTVGYRLRKFAQRYRPQVIAAVALLAAIATGSTGTVWFALEAARAAREVGRQQAIAQAQAEQAARNAEDALARKSEFDLLAAVVYLDEALAAEKALRPAWPDKIAAMQRWLDEDVGRLLEMRPRIDRALADLRASARPPTPAELEHDRTTHPEFTAWRKRSAKLAALERAQAVRHGAQPGLPLPTAEERAMTAGQLLELARPRVDPDEEKRTWGEEPRGLVLARLAWEKARDLPPAERIPFGDTLAQAWFANGQDREALAQCQETLALAGEDRRQERADAVSALQARIAEASGEAGATGVAALREEVDRLTVAVQTRRTYRFTDEAQRFLHDALTDLQPRLASLEQRRAAVVERLQWATRIEALTRAHPRARVSWAEAREAIAAADGTRASRLYRAHPIDLVPQMGLVPIGMNPATGLWEFYHLRSAWDGKGDAAALDIARHIEGGDRAGHIEVGDGTGIVFVLVPGGTFTMGAQRADPDGPNHDPHASKDTMPHRVTLAPFFLGRHEMTKGQWKRLSGDADPGWYRVGRKYKGNPDKIQDTNPVEEVDWTRCVDVLDDHGLSLPTEAQWEYACRAGTSSPWWTGKTAATLADAANVLDLTAEAVYPFWGRQEGDFHDNWCSHAPVGTYRANAFGMFDMHGNVWEWCADRYGPYTLPVRTGDGLRDVPEGSSMARVTRGGAANDPASLTRAARRGNDEPAVRSGHLGLRAARLLR